MDDDDIILGEHDQYRNNPLLKRAFTDIEWTAEMIQEWIKCSKDISYFIVPLYS